ncbi:unnamed protein product [Cyberlindnera jadinii]|uniref:Uncharacterized protein n=1 Tax=Cyberlindnera jadinii (strain ATCC 18201 / CBS 1600 / BCRC 20928 / JCM 3617 / NBRC 0987 / NRRL Y-1542) TaxID=983966 RepID=A0A0H5CHV3_CYBJN|nr:unnamed protein product [Cyberlindnera jadinii]
MVTALAAFLLPDHSFTTVCISQGLQMVRALLTGEFGQRGGTFWDVTVLRFHTTCDSEVRLGYSQISGS